MLGNGAFWHSAMNPALGSMVAAFLGTVCPYSNESSILKEISNICPYTLSLSRAILIMLVGVCDDDGHPMRAYQTLNPAYPGIKELSPIMAKFITSQMCGACVVPSLFIISFPNSAGTSALGLVSKYSAALDAIALVSKLVKPNDGLVEALSCQFNPGAVCENPA